MEHITPIPDEPAKPMEDEIADILCRFRSRYTDESINAAISEMSDPAKFNLVQSLHELENEVASS